MRAFTVIGDLGATSTMTPFWHDAKALHDFNKQSAKTNGWDGKIRVNITTLALGVGDNVQFSDKTRGVTQESGPSVFAQGVAKWQAANGAKVDGKIGSETWRKIQEKFTVTGKKPAKPSTQQAAPAVDPALDPAAEQSGEGTPWYLNISYPWYIGGGIVLVGLIGLFWPSSSKAQRKSGQLNGYSDEPTNVKQLRRAGYMIPERDGSYTMMPPGKRPYNLSHEAALTLVARKPDPERW